MTLTLQHYPALVLAARPGVVPGALSLSRPSVATCVNALGLVEEVPAHALRHDFDQATGAYLGWLVEEPRTNMVLQSRDMTAAVWSRTDITAVKDLAGADGVAGSGTRLTASAANAVVTQVVPAATARHVVSVDIRPLTVTGSVALTLDGGASWTDVTGALAEGRYTRVHAAQTLSNPTVGLRLSASGDSVAVDYAQVEAGACPTSRIATTSAAVVRQGDVLTVDDLTGFWNRTEGSLVMDVRAFGSDMAAATPRQTVLSVGDTSAASDRLIEVQRQPEYGLRGGLGMGTNAGYGAAATGSGLWAAEAYHRIALGWTAGQSDPSLVFDGALYRSALSGGGTVNAIDPEARSLAIGHQMRGGVQRHLSGHVRLLLHYPRRLPDATLQELTA